MTRTPLALAALASAAVPGLDPVGVAGVSSADDRFDVAVVTDTQERRWVIRCPRTEAAAAQLEQAAAYVALLARRMPFAVPIVRGWAALADGGRACVYPHLPGEHLDLARLPAEPGITAELGRTIATLHNADPALAEEAGLSFYTADEYRRRRLAELDRSASTGRVPADLLTRWEAALEDTSLWGFRPVPVHGNLTSEHVIAHFEDEEDASTGTVRALTGWEDAKVADPADDFAAVVAHAGDDAVSTLIEAYAHTRVERPDANLLVRARLLAEMAPLRLLLAATAAHDGALVDQVSFDLRALDAELAEAAPFTAAPPVPRVRVRPADLGAAGPVGTVSAEPATEPVEAPGAVVTPLPADQATDEIDLGAATDDDAVETEFDEEHAHPAVPVQPPAGPHPAASQPPTVERVPPPPDEGDEPITAPHPPVAPH